MEYYERLEYTFYQKTCTTGNELIGELGLAIREFLHTRPLVSPSLGKTLRACNR